jgi:NAD(P)-dependent dehydrogenase (short-subunit alcohol dehydrogenase family)
MSETTESTKYIRCFYSTLTGSELALASMDIPPPLAPQFVATKSANEIALRLRKDEALVNAAQPCSWIAWHLPAYSTEKGKEIAANLVPIPDLSHDIRETIYANLVNKIRRCLKNSQNQGAAHGNWDAEKKTDNLPLSDLTTALKVIRRLQDASIIQHDTPVEALASWLEQQVTPSALAGTSENATTRSDIPKPPPLPRKRLCYICRLAIANSYPSHPSICIPCGAFNFSSSEFSKPPRLSLPHNFIALVTGARINLGFHTALRLLRCGARVIATTRYPRDAVTRYLKEPDSVEWKDRLKVVGADFRSAADAFGLVHETKRCLETWSDGGEARLTAVINNAAQTLTDSVKKEERAIGREDELRYEVGSHALLIEGTYKARVRGRALPMSVEGTKVDMISFESSSEEMKTKGTEITKKDCVTTAEIELYTKSSWVQSMFEIPYEDVMSAHAVNTFVPLILIRELIPMMGYPSLEPSSSVASKPHAYIVNVSSREGIFEDRTNANAKNGKHVHTNMSKAALNMITETEAAPAWKSRRVAMNTVDPGYMSAAPEYENAFDGVRPIGWEDGAGRVLWPIAIGELEGRPIVGRFLKHYGAVEVDPSVGRG